MTNSLFCKNHPQIQALWQCDWCHTTWCGQCVRAIQIMGSTSAACQCGGGCHSTQVTRQDAFQVKTRPKNPGEIQIIKGKWSSYLNAVTYPFTVNGILLIIMGVIGYYAVSFVAAFNIFGFLPVFVIYSGFMAACYQNVIRNSADGKDQFPDWPEISELFSDIITPGFHWLACGFYCGIPLGLAIYFNSIILFLVSIPLGTFLWPITVCAVTTTQSLAPLFRPHALIASIFRTAGEYFAIYLISMLIFGLITVMTVFASLFNQWAVIPGLFLYYYYMCVVMRLLGLFLVFNEDRLEWFG